MYYILIYFFLFWSNLHVFSCFGPIYFWKSACNKKIIKKVSSNLANFWIAHLNQDNGPNVQEIYQRLSNFQKLFTETSRCKTLFTILLKL